MRILLAVPEFPPDNVGGGGEVAAALYAEYAKVHNVTVIAGRVGVVRDVPVLDVAIQWIPEFPYPRSHPFLASTMPPTAGGLLRLMALVRDVDIVHLHGYGFPLMDTVAYLSRLRKLPYVQTLHGFPVTPEKRGGWVAGAFAIYRRMLGNPTLLGASAHTAVGESVAHFYRDTYRIEASVVPNGTSPMPMAVRTRDQGPYTVLCVGRLEWIKDFGTVIRAVSRLRDARLRIAGRDNGAKESLLRIASDCSMGGRVELLGSLDRGRLAQEYANADCCVVSSVTEAFPAVPLESMRAGTPVISTPVGGVQEYGHDGYNLLLFTPGDDQHLSRLLERLRTQSELTRSLVENGKRTADEYLWPRVAREYLAIFSDVIERYGR